MVYIKAMLFHILSISVILKCSAIVEATDIETSNTKWQPSTVTERNKFMYNNSFMSDIKFTFGNNQSGEMLYAHKYVLATSSPVFYEIFYSASGKNGSHIYLPHSDNETIAAFFGFLYEDKCPTVTDAEKGLKILRLVMKYQVSSFDKLCKDSLEDQITAQDAFKLLEKFVELKAEAFVNKCFGYVDTSANEYFTSDYFLNIKVSTLDALLQRHTLDYSEVKVFKAVLRWVDYQCLQQNFETSRKNRRMILGDVVYRIRFMLMSLSEFTIEVLAVDFLSDHESIGIIKVMAGQHVKDRLIWDSPNLRRQRRPEATRSWWTYLFYTLISMVLCDCIGLWYLNRSPRR